jgi:transcriptional regulator with XRE-family HTH domain
MSPIPGLGSSLRGARLAQGLSLSDVAGEAGISVATLSRIETQKQNVDVSLLVEICRILGVSPATILGGNGGADHTTQGLTRELASLKADQRAQIFAAASRQASRSKGSRERVQARIENLLATIEMIRDELLDLRKTSRRR